MSAKTLDGRAVAAAIRAEVAERVRAFGDRPPGLAVILAGHDPASEVYVRGKIRACEELGIHSEQLLPPAEVSTAELLALVEALNASDQIDGILVQLPLPPQVDAGTVLLAVSPEKDVDGFHPVNLGRLVTQRPGPVPCTPAGIIQLLKRNDIAIAGKEAVVVGRSDIVGKPLALLLLHEHATVTIAHSRTRNLEQVCQRAELLFAAVGKAAMLNERHIHPGAVVVDVGVNRLTRAEDVERYFPGNAKRREEFERRGSTLIGDVDPRAACALASAFTPVPGGVGPLTIAMLMANTVAAAERRRRGQWTVDSKEGPG
ncbi:MAG TPA: bifunctional methylenetetrahydrofolate dehydrogenase/methenyltetrahydrofolate cyclohydrolase FolD [Terriglobales bacterium]|nr:bifunctional methylenetetrahydrofolate dehydrogenase/methenyltetrahydrofolate cyclohydrolase FolD [Terriglobales bacterium]